MFFLSPLYCSSTFKCDGLEFFSHYIISSVHDFLWPEVGFSGGCPLLRCWQHFTAVNEISAYAVTLISYVTASSKLIPSVNVFLTQTLQSKKPKEIRKPYNRESSHTLPLTFSEV